MLRKHKPSIAEILEAELVDAICYDKIDEVDRLLKMGVNPDTPSTKPALQMAVEKGDVSTIRKLLDRGANIEIGWSEYWNNGVLDCAAIVGRNEVIQELLSRKANVNRANNFGVTALHVAVQWLNDSTVKLLLENGAIVDCVNDDGETPLRIIARRMMEHREHFADPALPTLVELQNLRDHQPIELCGSSHMDNEEIKSILENAYVKKINIAKTLIDNGASLDKALDDRTSKAAVILQKYADSRLSYVQALKSVGGIYSRAQGEIETKRVNDVKRSSFGI
jgi:hypothetical protein